MKALSYIIAAMGTVALAIVLFGCGYFACAFPLTTQLLSQAFSNYETSPYSLDDLNTLAVASRDFTVDARPAGTSTDDARTAFDETLMLAATHSAQRYLGGSAATADKSEQGKRDMWNGLLDNLGSTAITSAFTLENANETADQMAAYSDAFALDKDAIRHLDDCNVLIQRGVYVVQVFGVIFLVCLVVLLIMRQRHAIGLMLSVAPVLLILAFLGMGAWAVLDFHGFFSAFHGVFFPQGNWTFSYESLLICMYPTEFWMGMGGVWLFTTLLASIILLVIGRKVLRSAR